METQTRRGPSSRVKRPLRERFWTEARLWAHDTFSREQLISALKSLAWVAPLTVLIWIYAEREQIVSPPGGIEFRVDAQNAFDKDRLVQLIDPADGKRHNEISLRADISGPNAMIGPVMERLRAAGAAVQLPVDPKLGPGIHTVPTNTIGRDALFRENGITVNNVLPREVEVYVDPIVSVEVDVQARSDVKNLESPPVFEPRKVRVSAPQSVIEEARQQSKLVAYAELKGFNEMSEPGAHELTNVPVVVPIAEARLSIPLSDARVTLTPSAVSAKVDVRRAEIEATIQSIPITVDTPQIPLWDNYKVETTTKFVQDVKVIGPPDVINDMTRPDSPMKPKARIDVASVSLPPNPATGGPYTATLKFDLPEKVHLDPKDTQHHTIEFRVVERKAAE